jgi:hypothetical protein
MLNVKTVDAGGIDCLVIGVATGTERVEVLGSSPPLEDIDPSGIHRIGRDREVEATQAAEAMGDTARPAARRPFCARAVTPDAAPRQAPIRPERAVSQIVASPEERALELSPKASRAWRRPLAEAIVSANPMRRRVRRMRARPRGDMPGARRASSGSHRAPVRTAPESSLVWRTTVPC